MTYFLLINLMSSVSISRVESQYMKKFSQELNTSIRMAILYFSDCVLHIDTYLCITCVAFTSTASTATEFDPLPRLFSLQQSDS